MSIAPTGGVLDLTAAQYHADDISDQPSLSASVAKILVSQSPAHARAAHPRLNPDYQRVDESKFDLGTVVHAMLLEGRDVVEVIHHGDYRTNAAKEDRDTARAAGKIPLLAHLKAEVDAMVAAVREQLAPELFADGKPEQTLVWEEDGVLCRSRIDWLRDDCTAVTDLKTTSRSANPREWERSALFKHGCDIQAALYLRGLKAVTGADAVWNWVVVETTPPYALSVITPGPEVLAVGNAKVDRALELWRDCLASGVWPAYSNEVTVASTPPWELRWLDNPDLEELAWAQM